MKLNKHISWILLILLAFTAGSLIIKFVPSEFEDSIEILQHLAIIAGVIIGLGLLNQKNALMVNENQRYIKAVELLESKSEPVRVGALHALAKISLERGFFEQCKQVIALYVQQECESSLMKEQKKEWQQSHKAHRMLFEDIKVAINILSKMNSENLINLKGVDLEGIDFVKSGVTLKNLDFTNANLKEAKFPTSAELSSCKFKGADLSGVDLSDMDLHGANLIGANLSDVDLSGSDLAGADLKGANLQNANLYSASLPYVNLNCANMQNTNLPESNLEHADLSNVQIQNASLKKSNLKNANLSGADLQEAYLKKADMTGANLEGAIIEEAQFIKTQMNKADYDNFVNKEKFTFTETSPNKGAVDFTEEAPIESNEEA